MNASIEVKMDKLAEKMAGGREDQLAEVGRMQKILKTAMLKKNLSEHPALTQLLGLLRKRERGYSILLSNKPKDEAREEWYARREEVRFVLKFFEVDKTIDFIDSELDYQLGDEISTGDEA